MIHTIIISNYQRDVIKSLNEVYRHKASVIQQKQELVGVQNKKQFVKFIRMNAYSKWLINNRIMTTKQSALVDFYNISHLLVKAAFLKK